MLQNKLLIVCLMICGFSTAQIRMTYSIGCVGNTNQKISVYSSSVAISGKSCFVVANGVNTFEKGKSGLFTSNCEVNPIVGRLDRNTKFSLRAFPNPVRSSVTIKSIDQLPTNEIVFVTVYAITGNRLKTYNITSRILYEGLKVDMQNYKKGVYVVKAGSGGASAEFKLIKID